MANTSADSITHNDSRSFQSFSPASCYMSTTGSTCSLSSSPNSVNAYGTSPTPEAGHRRGSEPAIQFRRYQNDSNEAYLNRSISDDPNSSISNQHSEINGVRPVNRFFPDGVVDILNKWFYENQSYPYPDENMTNLLAKEANISAKQVRKWFANKRVRSNKCYKQTFRIKKDSIHTKSHLNLKNYRRQTKSVSDSDSLQMNNNQSLYFENEFDDDQSSQEINDRKQYFWQDQLPQLSSSSSASSSPPNFAYSSPIVKNEYSNSHFFPHQNSFNESQFLHSNLNMNDSIANLEHPMSNTGANNYAAVYNPYILMNILKNPSIALQAVLANRLISLNNSDSLSNSSHSEQSYELNNSFQSSPAVHKRKTHLSNRFMNESCSLKPNNLHLIQEVSSLGDEHAANAERLDYQTPTIKKLLTKNTCSAGSNNSIRSSFSLDELSNLVNTASLQQNFSQLARNHNSMSIKTTKKIDFGDVSSLI